MNGTTAQSVESAEKDENANEDLKKAGATERDQMAGQLRKKSEECVAKSHASEYEPNEGSIYDDVQHSVLMLFIPAFRNSMLI